MHSSVKERLGQVHDLCGEHQVRSLDLFGSAASGKFDFINLIRGRIESDALLTKVIPIQGMASGPHLDFCGEVREETKFPILHAARISDVATARHAIAEGKLDVVGMTRAHIADPHIVNKVAKGREDQIRPCVGATYCLDRIYQGGAAHCIHNPSTGRELDIPHEISKADQVKRTVVVGAGPAGMEAARVAAERGHEVIVHEAASDPGGQVRLTAQSKRRREMISIINWRFDECTRLGVTFNFNSFADADTVMADAPDIVVIATGGLPHTDVLGEGNDFVVSSWDILSGDVKPGENVLVYDDAGDHAGLQAAEIIAETGAKVEIMTPDRSFAPEVMAMNLVPYMKNLQRKGVQFTVTWRLLGLARHGNLLRATIGSDYGDFTQEREVDQVIVNHGTRPLDDIYFDLKPNSTNLGEVDYTALTGGRAQNTKRNPEGAFQLFRIGDAIAARNTHAAILDAIRLLKDL